jgi:hypothetical protein
MDKKRRQKPQRWFEREGEGIIQRRQPRKTRFESAPTRRWKPQEIILFPDDGYEEEADFSQDRQ